MCLVACQADVTKYMLEKPILSVRIAKWAYALIEYDLAYESKRIMRGQVIADFIINHRIKDEENINCICVFPWKLYFDGSVYREGQGIGIVLISPNNVVYETSVHLEYFCTNNQTEYETFWFTKFSRHGCKGHRYLWRFASGSTTNKRRILVV
jgi:hypothetical protein